MIIVFIFYKDEISPLHFVSVEMTTYIFTIPNFEYSPTVSYPIPSLINNKVMSYRA